jgi:hypothetical protein
MVTLLLTNLTPKSPPVSRQSSDHRGDRPDCICRRYPTLQSAVGAMRTAPVHRISCTPSPRTENRLRRHDGYNATTQKWHHSDDDILKRLDRFQSHRRKKTQLIARRKTDYPIRTHTIIEDTIPIRQPRTVCAGVPDLVPSVLQSSVRTSISYRDNSIVGAIFSRGRTG